MKRFPKSVVLAGLLIVCWGVPGAAQEKKPDDGRLATKVTLAVEDITLEDLLGKLAKGSNLTFVVTDRNVLRAKRVAKLSVKNEPLGKVLTDALKPLGATYQAKPDYIEIVPAK